MLNTMSDEDAQRLIRALKDAALDEFLMPQGGEHGKGFQVTARQSGEVFRIDVYRGLINYDKHSVCARLLDGNVVLMRLCIGGHPHTNPDGSIIHGDHLHIYQEGFDDRNAISVDIESPNFVEDTEYLLKKFNVINKPILNDGIMP